MWQKKPGEIKTLYNPRQLISLPVDTSPAEKNNSWLRGNNNNLIRYHLLYFDLLENSVTVAHLLFTPATIYASTSPRILVWGILTRITYILV